MPAPAARHLNRAAGRVLRGEVAPVDADPDLARLGALAAAGDVITLVSAGQRRAFAGQLGALTALAGHAALALAALALAGRGSHRSGDRTAPKV